ncbi:hypothetical protein CDD83_3048 [Cordyceps sp. RAO-2017]|nr:hypothetical protein CDD83_3048 [Cordyceps sp. RAO-2017]
MGRDVGKFLEEHGPTLEESLGKDVWYLVVLSALTTGNCYSTAGGEIYEYLTRKPEYAATAQRRALVRRFCETMMKLVVLTGIPKSLQMGFSWSQKVADEDNDVSFTRRGWAPEQTIARANAFAKRVHQDRLDPLFKKMEAYPDARFAYIDVAYGLFLSDDATLSNTETEIITVSSYVTQGTVVEATLHKKGLLGLGVEEQMVERILSAVAMTAEFMGITIPTV